MTTPEQESTEETIPVTVVIARVGFQGFYCLGGSEYVDVHGKVHRTLRGKAGVFFPNGPTDLEVTTEELAALKAEEAKTVPIIDQKNGKEIGRSKALPITVIQYSRGEMALRRAAAAERAAAEAEAEAERAMAAAQAKAEVAKRLTANADAIVSAAEKAKPQKQAQR